MRSSTTQEEVALRRNPVLVCAYHACLMSLFPIAILSLFYDRQIGMSMSDILLLQGFFGLVLALFEFPSGYLADRIGYRITLLCGAVFGVVGWSIYANARTIAGVAVAEAALGVAISLISGTNRAILYESLAALGRADHFSTWEARLQFFGQLSEGTCALVAGWLYVQHASLPFWASVASSLAMVGFALAMVEPPRTTANAPANHLHHAWAMVRYALRESKALRSAFLISIVFSMVSYLPVWIIPLYTTDAGVPESWLGPIWSIANYTVAVFALVSPRLEARWGAIRVLGACTLLILVGYVGLGLTEAWWGFAFYFVLTVLRGVRTPIVAQLENSLIPSADRAGFLSLRSLLFRLSFLALAPFVGAAVDQHGYQPVWLASGVLLFGLAWLALVMHIRSARS